MYKCPYSEVLCSECPRRWSCEVNKLIGDLTAIRHVCPMMAVMEHCVYDDSDSGYLKRDIVECIAEAKHLPEVCINCGDDKWELLYHADLTYGGAWCYRCKCKKTIKLIEYSESGFNEFGAPLEGGYESEVAGIKFRNIIKSIVSSPKRVEVTGFKDLVDWAKVHDMPEEAMAKAEEYCDKAQRIEAVWFAINKWAESQGYNIVLKAKEVKS